MLALTCPKCGAPSRPGATDCPYCGVGLASEMPGERRMQPERPQPPVDVPPGWKLFKDEWHGFSLAHPAGWRVEVSKGQVSVREDAAGLTSAVIWPFRLRSPGVSGAATTARAMAAAFVKAGNQFAKGFQAWEQGNAAPDSSRISLRTRQTRFKQIVEGTYNILVDQGNCIISGYEAPAPAIANRSPVLGQILSTFRTAALMKREVVRELKENAFQILMPEGWGFAGQVNRNNMTGSGMPAFSAAQDPQEQVVAAMPSLQMVYQDVISAFSMGVMGYEVDKYYPADQYCIKKAAKKLEKQQKSFRLEAVTLRPDLAEIEEAALVQAGYPAGTMEVSVAVMDTTNVENGVRLRQRMRVATMHQRGGIASLFTAPNPFWTAITDMIYRAPEGALDEIEPVLTGILDSVMVNPAWQAQEQQRVQMQQIVVQNYIANAQADMARRRTDISRTLSQTSDLITSSYWDQQPAYDRTFNRYENTMLGNQDVQSQNGEVYRVPYGYDQYWQDGLGNLIGGSWMATPDINWKPLTPTGV